MKLLFFVFFFFFFVEVKSCLPACGLPKLKEYGPSLNRFERYDILRLLMIIIITHDPLSQTSLMISLR